MAQWAADARDRRQGPRTAGTREKAEHAGGSAPKRLRSACSSSPRPPHWSIAPWPASRRNMRHRWANFGGIRRRARWNLG